MNGKPNSFYVTFFSINSLKAYHDNSIGAFTVQLANGIDLVPMDGRWDCKLSCPPPSVGTVKPALFVGKTNAIIYWNLISTQFIGEKKVDL